MSAEGAVGRQIWLRSVAVGSSIRKGTRVAFVDEGDRIILQPITPEFIHSLRGCLGKDSSALEILLEERRRERELLTSDSDFSHGDTKLDILGASKP